MFLKWISKKSDAVNHKQYHDVLEKTEFFWLSERLDKFIHENEYFITFEYQSHNSRYYVVKMIQIPFPVLFSNMSIIIVQDVTAFVQSKRAVAWASMAQKLAHEIKTPLSTVLLSAQQIEAKSSTKKYVRHILEQVERLQTLTDDMLKFAHIEKIRMETVLINDLILETLKALKIQIGSSVKVKTKLEENHPSLKGDRQQLSIVIKNCMCNSLNAMQGKGILYISTKLIEHKQASSQKERMHWIKIEIKDTGKGMTKKELSMLFQPFFTKSGNGTGLGMVIVKKIVDDHRGTIEVESKKGIGTNVKITLPGNLPL